MSRILFATAFLLGAATIAWMGSAFVDSDALALAVTLVIAAVYSIGFIELFQFRQATFTLSSALASLPEKINSLDEWLPKLHPTLQNAVRLRIEGERIGLPAPVITPYLVGLLVMLGLLGTFLGMVDTLQGAVIALQGTTELQAIRAGLAAPIQGLGLAFGTSVAGVAASAMLGLVSTVSRRDRMLATRCLDGKISSDFRQFSLIHNRQETFKALQIQAHALPDVAERLQALVGQIERMGDQLGSTLISNQEMFHQSVKGSYSDLASSVEQSLRDSMAQSGRLAGEGIKPIVKELMVEISNETQKTHRQLTTTAREQLEALTGQFKLTSEKVSQSWEAGIAAHQQSNEGLVTNMGSTFEAFSGQFERATATLLESFNSNSSAWVERQSSADEQRLAHWSTAFEQAQQQALSQQQAMTTSLQQTASEMGDTARSTSTQMLGEISRLLSSSEQLVETRIASEANWLAAHGERMEAISSTLGTELQSLRTEEEQRGQAAIDRLSELQHSVSKQLATLGKELEEPMTRLIETASETPRAAAEVIGHLRREISNNIERDNSLLEERQRIMEQLNSLSGSLQQSTSDQREAVETLVNSSTDMLKGLGSQFSEHVDTEVSKMSDIAATLADSATEIADNFAGSAIEMSSLGEAFSLAVKLFNESNGSLIDTLNRIEESLDKSTVRSDEQLGYYVAQAREIIDHSVLSQKEIFDELRQFSHREETRLETAETELS